MPDSVIGFGQICINLWKMHQLEEYIFQKKEGEREADWKSYYAKLKFDESSEY